MNNQRSYSASGKFVRVLLGAVVTAASLTAQGNEGQLPGGQVPGKQAPGGQEHDPQEPANAGAATQQAAGFDGALGAVEQRLTDSLAELDKVRTGIADEKVPLGRQLSELESQLSELRAELQRKTREVDQGTLELDKLRTSIKAHQEEANYVGNLLTDYLNNFKARLHVAELKRYATPLDNAQLAVENTTLDRQAVFAAQVGAVEASLDRAEDALGGTTFAGEAVDTSGTVREGTFVLVGPTALFRSGDGQHVGTVEQPLNSMEPTLLSFEQPETTSLAGALVQNGAGTFPLDPTLGNAHKIESTHETFLEHVKKGGVVMYPIFLMGGLALLVAIFKWVSLALVARPSRRQMASLLDSVAQRDNEAARAKAKAMRGPTGRMLRTGTEHLGESKDLLEEVMYEQVLTTKLHTNRWLPFLAICAASAPLLGLLGTVTGIIDTFKQITLFGSGDVKNLSSGISEALITTEFGLIVAIPSLLLHSFLSRKARGVVGGMERSAVAFVNEATKAEAKRVAVVRQAASGAAPDPDLVREHVHSILTEIMGPLLQNGDAEGLAASSSSRS
ncbi:MAG: MotA/TolQ/ExbB proton channel family protein [Planctomycetota bacterium]